MTAALVQKLAENRKIGLYRKVTHNFEAGVVLEGWEVKAVKRTQVSIEGAYVVVRNKVPLLVGVTITPAKCAFGVRSSAWKRQRKLLFHRKETNKIQHILKQTGLAAIPENLYARGKLIKCGIVVVKRKEEPEVRRA